MGPQEFIVVITVVIILLVTVTMIALFVLFTRRKDQLHRENIEIKEKFNQELTNASIEIREETLRNISWELHDNVGQLLTLAKLQTQRIQGEEGRVGEVKGTISKALNEIRSLSKAINPDALKKLNLINALQQEVDRYNRLEYLSATLHVKGTVEELQDSHQIILFRIVQEFCNNTLKHAKASRLSISLDYQQDFLDLTVQDDGIGFDVGQTAEGIGLINMKQRAHVLGADLDIISSIGQGSLLKIRVHNQKERNNA